MTFDILRTWREAMFTKQQEFLGRKSEDGRQKLVRSFILPQACVTSRFATLRTTRTVSAISCLGLFLASIVRFFNRLSFFYINANSHIEGISSFVLSSHRSRESCLAIFVESKLNLI
jgi:hypothetical protein